MLLRPGYITFLDSVGTEMTKGGAPLEEYSWMATRTTPAVPAAPSRASPSLAPHQTKRLTRLDRRRLNDHGASASVAGRKNEILGANVLSLLALPTGNLYGRTAAHQPNRLALQRITPSKWYIATDLVDEHGGLGLLRSFDRELTPTGTLVDPFRRRRGRRRTAPPRGRRETPRRTAARRSAKGNGAGAAAQVLEHAACVDQLGHAGHPPRRCAADQDH